MTMRHRNSLELFDYWMSKRGDRPAPSRTDIEPADIRRLLAERPDAAGLTVPQMPAGSPGMDFGDDRDPYDVLLVRRDGSDEVYASYNK